MSEEDLNKPNSQIHSGFHRGNRGEPNDTRFPIRLFVLCGILICIAILPVLEELYDFIPLDYTML